MKEDVERILSSMTKKSDSTSYALGNGLCITTKTRGGNVNFHFTKGSRSNGKIVKSKTKNLLTLNIDQYRRMINFHSKLTSDYYEQLNEVLNEKKFSSAIWQQQQQQHPIPFILDEKHCEDQPKKSSAEVPGFIIDDTTQDFFGAEEVVETTHHSMKPYTLKRT